MRWTASWPKPNRTRRSRATLRTPRRCGGSTRWGRRSGWWCASRCSQMRDEDLEALRHGYEALNRGAVESIHELFDPDIEWQPGQEDPQGGTFTGRADF